MLSLTTHAENEDLAPGEYTGTITKAEETVSKKSGNPMLALRVQVQSQSVRDWILWTPNFQPKIRSFMAAIGQPVEADGADASIYAEDLVGKDIRVVVILKKDDDGTDRPAIAKYLPPLNEDAPRRVSMRDLEGQGQAKPVRRPRPSTPIDDEGIPF